MQALLEKQEKFAALTTMMAGITVQQLDAAQAACVQNPAGGAPPLVRKPEAIGMTCGGVAGAQNLGVPLAGLTAAGDVILYPAVVTRNAAGIWECTQPYCVGCRVCVNKQRCSIFVEFGQLSNLTPADQLPGETSLTWRQRPSFKKTPITRAVPRASHRACRFLSTIGSVNEAS